MFILGFILQRFIKSYNICIFLALIQNEYGDFYGFIPINKFENKQNNQKHLKYSFTRFSVIFLILYAKRAILWQKR